MDARAGLPFDGLGWIEAAGPSALPGMQDFALIADGPRSTVYRARQVLLGGISRTVAVKILHGSRHERVWRELELTVGLGDHPNIITVYDISVALDGTPYVVMEHCPLGSLAVRRDGRSVDQAVAAGVAVADALVFAHGRGIIHRDIKPDNILIRAPEPNPSSFLLADFGIARPVDAAITGSIHTGTYLYASPQHIQAKTPAVTDDIWSLGATLYTLLEGTPPFSSPDQQDNQGAYLVRVIKGAPRPFRRDDVPAALHDIVTRCLNKDPAGRYAHAADLRNALAAIRSVKPPSRTAAASHDEPAPAVSTDTGEMTEPEHESIAASALAHVRPASDPTTGQTTLPAPPPSPGVPRPRRRLWLAVSAGAAAILVVASFSILDAWRDEAQDTAEGEPTASVTNAGAMSQAQRPTTAVATRTSPIPSRSVTRRPAPAANPPPPREADPHPGLYGGFASAYSGRCLGVLGSSRDDGAAVVQWGLSWESNECGVEDQRWGWVGGYGPDGQAFKIVNKNSGKCFDVADAITPEGAMIVQTACRESGGTQLWRRSWYDPQNVTAGWQYWKVANVRSGLCLSVPTGSKSDGVQIRQWPCDNKGEDEQPLQFRVPA